MCHVTFSFHFQSVVNSKNPKFVLLERVLYLEPWRFETEELFSLVTLQFSKASSGYPGTHGTHAYEFPGFGTLLCDDQQNYLESRALRNGTSLANEQEFNEEINNKGLVLRFLT